MDASEERRKRLKALRGQALGGPYERPEVPHAADVINLSNPLLEKPIEENTRKTFSFYSDPLASFTMTQRTRKAVSQPPGLSKSAHSQSTPKVDGPDTGVHLRNSRSQQWQLGPQPGPPADTRPRYLGMGYPRPPPIPPRMPPTIPPGMPPPIPPGMLPPRGMSLLNCLHPLPGGRGRSAGRGPWLRKGGVQDMQFQQGGRGRGRGRGQGRFTGNQETSIAAYVHPSMTEDPWAHLRTRAAGKLDAAVQQEKEKVAEGTGANDRTVSELGSSSLADLLDDALEDAKATQREQAEEDKEREPI